MNKLLDSLHKKILKSKFAEEVTEAEIDALVEAKEYNGGWIPCSERLPEDDRDVLVVMSDGSMMVDFRTASSSGWFWSDNDDMPLAWHELPQPYQPKGE